MVEPRADAGSPEESASASPGARRPARRREQVAAEVVGSDYALHDARSGRVHFLNQSAAAVWDLADGSRTAEEIVGELARLFGAGPEEVRPSVIGTLADFEREGLIEFA